MDSCLKKHLVVGLGSIGRRHAGLLQNKGYEVTGVDLHPVENVDFEIFDSLQAGLHCKPDMVWLCSPTALHAEQACQVIRAGLHLFIEKPLAHTLAHAQKILKCYQSQKNNKLVWVACNMRFHPAVIRLKAYIDEGRIGKPMIFRFHFSHWLPNMRPGQDYRKTYTVMKQGGGIVLDDIHDIDLAVWLAGKAESVTGFKMTSGALEMAAEDIASICIRHENKIFSHIHMDFLRQDKSRGIEVIGDKGTLEWRSYGKNPELAEIRYFSAAGNRPDVIWSDSRDPVGRMFDCQLSAVEKAVHCPMLFKKGLEEGEQALKVALAVHG